MVDKTQEDIRWLRIKLAETKDEAQREYILKQLELLESVDVKQQTLLEE